MQDRRSELAEESLRPVERAVEARTEGQQLNSLVRCGVFCETNVESGNCINRSIWIGTQGGCVFVYLLSVPNTSLLRTEIRCFLAKEIRLRHCAPVLSLTVVDAQGVSVKQRERRPEGSSAVGASSTDHHRVIICSEEQIKVFHLPSLKAAKYKCKLTAVEGMRIRKVQYVEMRSKSKSDAIVPAVESFLVVMTNQGVLQVYDTRHLRRQFSVACIPAQHVSGIFSTVLTASGEGLYLLSGSQWQRFTVGHHGISLSCSLELNQSGNGENEREQTENDGNSRIRGRENSTTDGGDSKSPSADTTVDSIRDFTKTTSSGNAEEHLSDAKAVVSSDTRATAQNIIKEITITEEVTGNISLFANLVCSVCG
ncbi:unnamed protein product [Soboliphyme baturini]|uniref:CNH domain-containing protein n=1 Tax=Soboliphyme baturini TaxID=241478 RepID=A0A183J3F3_9BILA|nr:unnamed protein product [Soboliphyme baturini]